MKIIKIVHVITSLKIGGAETVLYNIAKHLDTQKFQQTVIYFYDGPIRPQIENLGIKTYKIDGFFFRYDLHFCFKLLQILKKIKPDIIHSSLWSANLFATICAKILKIPIVCSLHTHKDHQGNLRNFLDKITFKLAKKIIAVSFSVAQSFVNNKLQQKITTICNSIDYKYIQSKSSQSSITRYQLNIDENDFVVGSVGRFVKVKKFDLLIQCISLLKEKYINIKLIIVGIGPELELLKNLVNSLELSNIVKFIVAKPAYNYYHIFNCFVQTSEYEGLSIALLEALSCQIPCITTAQNKYHDVIKHDLNGLLIEHDNLEMLYQTIENLYLDCKKQKKLAINGKKTVENNFSINNMIDLYSQTFKELI